MLPAPANNAVRSGQPSQPLHHVAPPLYIDATLLDSLPFRGTDVENARSQIWLICALLNTLPQDGIIMDRPQWGRIAFLLWSLATTVCE